MAYRSFAGNSASPWASGAPPGHGAPPPMPYGHPTQAHMGSSYGPAQRGPPGPYGSAAGAWGAAPHAAGPPVGNWGAHPMTRGRGPMPQPPPMKRQGNWMDNNGPVNKKFARGGHKPNFGRGGGPGGYKGNKNFMRKPPHNQNKKNDTSKQQFNAAKNAAGLPKKEYPAVAGSAGGEPISEIDKDEARYNIPVYGFLCKLCDVFLKDKVARKEHLELESHKEKFTTAEEERKKKEAEEAEKKKEEAAAGDKTNETEKEEKSEANGGETQANDETASQDQEKKDSEETTEKSEPAVANGEASESAEAASQENATSAEAEQADNKNDDSNAAATVDGEANATSATAETPAPKSSAPATPSTIPTIGAGSGPANRGGGGRGRGGRGGRGRGRGRGGR